ncbi:MAG: hypothetical protein E7110_00785 [Bacteroidales bacterium]|nr:hypothetical protein [Bacteroidales bacterium]
MKHTLFCFLAITALLCCNAGFAQEQPQKSPEEQAIEEANRLEKELKLTATQTFYVDSILRHNFELMYADIENLKDRGSQDVDTYRAVSDKWIQKVIDALKPVLDEQQHIKYLKLIGRGKEYKKGKDGKYYLKEDLKKKKK